MGPPRQHQGHVHPLVQWRSPRLQRMEEENPYLLQENGADQSEGGGRSEPDWKSPSNGMEAGGGF